MLLEIVDWVFYAFLGFDPASRLVSAMHFFVYDFIKILFLLFVFITLIGVLRTYVSQERVKALLAKKGFGKYVLASCFGVITPFCSCSSVPLFIGFVEAGVPLGVTFAFLTTSPLVNEFVAVLMLGLFGWKVTLVYVLLGILVGVVAGMVISKLGMEHHLVSFSSKTRHETRYATFIDRIRYGWNEAVGIVKKLWVFVAIGVAIGAAIHNYVPASFIESLVSSLGVFGVPVAALLGIPLYGNGAAIVPVAVALFEKGVPLGTALAFLMATVGLSFPEAVILRRVMKLPLIGVFFGVVAAAIVIIGYLLNAFAFLL